MTPLPRLPRVLLAMAGALLAVAFHAAASAGGTDGAGDGDEFVPAARQAGLIGIITIRGPVDDMTLKTVERRLDDAARDGCQAVVIELDTPGGSLPPTLALCHMLKTRSPANKVAWIHPQAFSAGVILALACREIVVSKESVLGDAAPIAVVPGVGLQPLPTQERAKLEAPVLSEVTDSALRNGYDVRLARAFVHTSDELWLIERNDGRRMFANAEECRIVLGGDPPRSGERFVPEDEPPPIEVGLNEPTDDIEQEALVREPRLTAAEAGQWRLLGQVDSADELVTLRGREARRFGLASAIVDTDDELLAYFGASSLIRYPESWSESLVRFLISWPVRGILIVVMLICLFVEMATPGFGVFGTASFIAFILLVGAPALAGLAQWWEIALIVIGVVLIILELLVLPGLGVAGAAGTICLLVGLVFSFVGGDLSSPTSKADLLAALFATLGSFLVAGVGIAILAKHAPSLPFFRRLVLDADVASESAALAIGPAQVEAELSREGIALTDLRPAGRVQCGDRVVDARSAGAWIMRGTPVRVVDHDGLSLIVEAVT